jgi:hypothetical protein
MPLITTQSAKGFGFGSLVPSSASYESIATWTGTSATTVTFSSIPSTYSHLQLAYFYLPTGVTAYDDAYLRFNGDSGTNYTFHQIAGDGSNPRSQSGTYTAIFPQPANTNSPVTFTVGTLDIYNYATTGRNRTMISNGGFEKNGSGDAEARHFAWLNTANAISSITVVFQTGGIAFDTRSHWALYGIKG